MKHNELSYLINWFNLHCNECWEHMYGITISTQEDGGWQIGISLEDTDLEELEFAPIDIKTSKDNWIQGSVREKRLHLSVSSNNVLEALRIFQNWSESLFPEIYDLQETEISRDQFMWLLKWYELACTRGLNSNRRIVIVTLDNPGWDLSLKLEGTNMNINRFVLIDEIDRTDDDWCYCFIRDNVFRVTCGTFNLGESLNMFKKFIDFDFEVYNH